MGRARQRNGEPGFDDGELRAALLAALTPLVGSELAATLSRADPRTVQITESGRITLRLGLEGGPALYCKLFPDLAEGQASHAKLLALWQNGFGGHARWRVVEPLAWLPGPRALVTREAPGVPLWERFGARGDGDGARLAAGWLAQLHATQSRVGTALDGTAEALGLASRIARVAARNPDACERLCALTSELRRRAQQVAQPQPTLQIHGTYSPWHVLVSPEAVTAMDLDNCCPGDPAADLGEFIHWLRYGLALGPAGEPAADRATASFLDAYGRERPIDAASLAYHWSLGLAGTLVNALEKRRRTQRAEERVRFYEREFAAAPERVRRF